MSLVKKQMAAQIQQQIDAAKKVLAAAESQASMTQAELGQEMAKLSQLEGEVDEARVQVTHAAKALHAVEADLLENLPTTCALAQAQSAVEQKRREVHQAMHRILNLPDHAGDLRDADMGRLVLDDLAHLTAAQRAALKDDTGYQTLQTELREAGTHADQARRELFESDPDWTAAQKELAQAQQDLAEERRETKTAAADSGRDKRQLYTTQSLAAQARAIIVQGELRLKQLNSMSSSRSRYGSRYPQRRR
jgi:hypothetical protein